MPGTMRSQRLIIATGGQRYQVIVKSRSHSHLPQLTSKMTTPTSETLSEAVEPPESTMSKALAMTIPPNAMSHASADSNIESLPAPSLDAHDSTSGEYEDETSSETHEAVTPTSETHPAAFHHQNVAALDGTPTGIAVLGKNKNPPPLISEPASLPASMGSHMVQPATPLDLKSRPKAVSRRSTTSKIHHFFHRRTQDAAPEERQAPPPPPTRSDSDEALVPVSAFRRFSGARSAHVSPVGSMANSPPLSESPNATISQSGPQWTNSSSEGPSLAKHKRSTTGLKENVGRIMFNTSKEPRPSAKRRNSMTGAPFFKPDNSISIPAAAGVGLKARRMSASLPDNFDVDTVELNTEYTSTSVIPGRRGKTLGKGATASVKLMAKKGGPSECVYAVKEFRKKGQDENLQEYEQKVKSEFSIAKSLHHPNIVESFRLCTHSGRWNHVMEYCPLEVYSLVEKKYMSPVDKNCLFKQLLRGVVYLHDHGIAHRDIKLENLLMTLDGQLKITDFGVSEVFCGEHPGVRAAAGECGKNMKEVRRSAPGICGSLPYIAPEVIEKNGRLDSDASPASTTNFNQVTTILDRWTYGPVPLWP